MSVLSNTVSGPERGSRIIIIEDEPLIAENLRADLVDAGFEVVGTASRIGEAMKLIEETECDAAILDANLAGVSSVPVVTAITERKIPCVVLSGYARDQLPSEFSKAFYVQKPYRVQQLTADLTALVAKRK